jgi:hypothetical protein
MTPHQYRNRVERKRLKLERKYIALLEKVFNKQLNDFTKAIEDNLYGAVYSIDIYFNDVLLERALTRLWQETGEEFRIDNVEAILIKSINQETWVSLMSNWIATEGAEKIKTINGFTKEFVQRKLRPVLTDGVQQGLGIPEISKNIIQNVKEYQGPFSKYRAKRVARTEIVGMSNRASFMSAESAGLQNNMQKFWIPYLDDNTRDSHRAMDGKPAIPLDEPFILEGQELMYPGDPNGSAEMVINCRCVIGYRRIGDENVLEAETTQQDLINQTEIEIPQQEIIPEFEPTEAKFTDIDKLTDDVLKLVPNDTASGEFVSGEFRTIQNAIAEAQGFRGLPKVLSDEDFIKLAKNKDYTLMYRGVDAVDDATSQKFIQNYIKGDLYGASDNLFGNGTYWAGQKQFYVALDYAGGKTSNVFPALIKKSDLKIGDYSKLVNKYRDELLKHEEKVVKKWIEKTGRKDLYSPEFRKQFPKEYSQFKTEDKMFVDFGSWATSNGYDAYTVQINSIGTGLKETTDYIVTLNRTKTIVSETLRGEL